MAKRSIPDRRRKRFADADRPPFVEQLAEQVRALRRAHRLRQDEVADVAGVSLSFVRDLEAGKPGLRLDRLLEVLDVLGLALAIVPAGSRGTESDEEG